VSPYAISKHGVLGLTKTDAQDYATDGIRINAISPGWVMTEITKMLWDSPMVRDCEFPMSFGTNLRPERHGYCQSTNGSLGYAGRDSLHS